MKWKNEHNGDVVEFDPDSWEGRRLDQIEHWIRHDEPAAVDGGEDQVADPDAGDTTDPGDQPDPEPTPDPDPEPEQTSGPAKRATRGSK